MNLYNLKEQTALYDVEKLYFFKHKTQFLNDRAYMNPKLLLVNASTGLCRVEVPEFGV